MFPYNYVPIISFLIYAIKIFSDCEDAFSIIVICIGENAWEIHAQFWVFVYLGLLVNNGLHHRESRCKI